MSYIKKKYQVILNKSDKTFIIPDYFIKFKDKKEKTHNLIIKSKGGCCYCTNCKFTFTTKAKINEIYKCPNCHQKLLIKSDRLQEYTFKDNLQLLDKVDDVFVLRTFELYSTYNNYKVNHTMTEFMRSIIENNDCEDFVTNQVHNHMGYMYIAHYQTFTNWYKRNKRWSYRDIIGIVCPYNIKSLIKNTDLKYSQLDKFISKSDYIDFIYYFTNVAHYRSFEMLVKMELYNLAYNANKFYTGKNFEEIFGIPKIFYSFMKKYNITYEELEILKLIKKQDIKLIRKLVGFHNLKELSNYVDLEKAYNIVLSKDKYYEHEYLDYLRVCKQLQYNMKDSKILYPTNLIKEHNKVNKILEDVIDEANDKLIKERLKLLNNNIYQNKKYIVFPADSTDSLINESKQMENCVKTYTSRYALGETDIYFMRELANKDKSLVTIEVRNGKVIQSRIKCNQAPSTEQLNFIDKWSKLKLLNT